MQRAAAIAALVAVRGEAITITTEQAIGAWRAAVAEPPNEMVDHLDIVGCMGSASTIGLGVALAQPQRKVIVVDGDGSLLMQLGSLVTIAGAAPSNLYHFVFENGVYETSGSQPLPAEGRVSLYEMARAAGYAHAVQFDAAPAFAAALPDLLARRGPVFVSVRTEPEDGFLRRSSAGTRLDLQMHALRARLAPALTEPRRRPVGLAHGLPPSSSMASKTTWEASTKHGELDSADRESLPDSVYAFPKQRKEPLTDARHVRNALARFDQVEGVSDVDREVAFANIKKAAEHYGVEVSESSWHELGKQPASSKRSPK